MSKKRICIDARMIGSSGHRTYLKNLLMKMNLVGNEVVLLIPSGAKREKDFLQRFSLRHCDAPVYSMQEQWQLPRLIPRSDLFWSPHFNVPVGPVRAKKRLVTIHDVFHLANRFSLRWGERVCVKGIISQAVKRSDKIITVSQFSRDEIMRFTGVSGEKISVIFNGVDQGVMDLRKIEVIKRKYELPERFFLYVGNIKPHKNLQGLLKGYYSFLKRKEGNCPIFIVGRKRGLLQTESIGEIIDFFPGLRQNMRHLEMVSDEELPIFYQLATCLVFPSFYEGFGLPPLEAMSMGCPVIASAIPPVEEVCGEAVYYIDPYDPFSIARGMREMYEDERMREGFIAKGKERAKGFLWEKSAEEHVRVIEEMIG
jgi:glycosyltransferase involved in cell wall biosynthesis